MQSLVNNDTGWSLWSKDIFFVITPDSTAGPQAWVDAYHSTHDTRFVDDLQIRGGALQGAVALDYPAGTGGHRYDKIHIVYDGVNGQLPNLDLINTVTVIASDYMGIGTAIQRMWNHDDSYKERMKTMLHGMLVQGLGHASGPHSSFIPYHVDAITLQTVGDGWHDEISLGRLVESTFRSLNNLLEHLHQSFFFYLLMNARRFVSIGTYLPSAMLVAINFSIMSIALWVQSGRPRVAAITSEPAPITSEKDISDEKASGTVEVLEHRGMITVVPKQLLAVEERALLFPTAFVFFAHCLGLAPLYVLGGGVPDVRIPTGPTSNVTLFSNHAMNTTFVAITLVTTVLPYGTAYLLRKKKLMTMQAMTLIPCISLLLVGIMLATLSTLNFSLGLLVGLAASPLSLLQAPLLIPTSSTKVTAKKNKTLAVVTLLVLHLFSPTTLTYIASAVLGKAGWGDVGALLSLASEAWTVHATYTAGVVWLLWWPAWFVAVVCAASRLFPSEVINE